MQHTFHICSITYQEVGIDALGDYTLDLNTAGPAKVLQTLKAELGATELYYLATCNRILFLFCRETPPGTDDLHLLFGEKLPEALLVSSGQDAVRYLFEVAASIHSLVVGEREIIKQIRDAYEQQLSLGISGDCIRLLIQHTVRTAKKIYAQTRIGERPVSVVSLAVKKFLAHNLPSSARFVLVGAGDTISLMLKHLRKRKYSHFDIYNRTLARAAKLAATVDGRAYELSQLRSHAAPIDVVISCTGAHQPILTSTTLPDSVLEDVQKVIWIDLSIPADLDAELAQQAEHYIVLSSLQDLAQENMAYRRQEVSHAEELISASLAEFEELLDLRTIELAFQEIPVEVKQVRQRAINEVFAKELQTLDPHSRKVIDQLMDYMEKKCVGIPMRIAKETRLNRQ